MAKPQNLCKLAKGKALGAFDGFVETFNWLVDFCNNLKGEGDIDNSKTLIVDTSVPDAPVIRGGGGGTGNPDDLSLDDDGADDTLEIKAFQTATAGASSIAQLMTTDTSSASGHDLVGRYAGATDKEVEYRIPGSFSSGSDSNVVFTSGSNGAVTIDVYYV